MRARQFASVRPSVQAPSVQFHHCYARTPHTQPQRSERIFGCKGTGNPGEGLPYGRLVQTQNFGHVVEASIDIVDPARRT